jgi:hypothetical protein
VVWWIVAGVTIVPLVALVVAAAVVGERLMELQRVADLTARQRGQDQQHLQARAASVQQVVAGLEQRAEETRRLLARLKRPDVRLPGQGYRPRSDDE